MSDTYINILQGITIKKLSLSADILEDMLINWAYDDNSNLNWTANYSLEEGVHTPKRRVGMVARESNTIYNKKLKWSLFLKSITKKFS